MQQRQLRLGDVLDDYCPRERRITNHAVVAMVGPDVKQTRCTTCDAEHEYKHARVPRQRRKPDTPAALYSQVLAGGPKRVVHEPSAPEVPPEEPAAAMPEDLSTLEANEPAAVVAATEPGATSVESDEEDASRDDEFDGPVHRPLIRATLPRPEGQPPPTRPAPEFTIRQPGGRPGRFRPRPGRGGKAGGFYGNRPNGTSSGPPTRGGAPRSGGGRPSMNARPASHQHGRGRKRSK